MWPLKFAFGGMVLEPGPDVSAIRFQSGGDGAPGRDRDGAGCRWTGGGGLRSQGSSGASEVGCAQDS